MAIDQITGPPSPCREFTPHQLRTGLQAFSDDFRVLQAACVLLNEQIEHEVGGRPYRLEVLISAVDGRLSRLSDSLDKLVTPAGEVRQ